MQCIDDLETLFANGITLWGGLKESALYNQDWLFCWCLQVRFGGEVVIGDFEAFEDISFPQDKCIAVADAARSHVGIHHTNPRRMRALWRAYLRANASGALSAPARRGCGEGGWQGRQRQLLQLQQLPRTPSLPPPPGWRSQQPWLSPAAPTATTPPAW